MGDDNVADAELLEGLEGLEGGDRGERGPVLSTGGDESPDVSIGICAGKIGECKAAKRSLLSSFDSNCPMIWYLWWCVHSANQF